MERKGSITLNSEIIIFNKLNNKNCLKNAEVEMQFANEKGTVITDTGPKLGKRHIQVLSCFLLVIINQCLRQHLSLTIVAMTNPDINTNKDIPIFDWKNRNVILSSFFWGYVGPQILTGWLMTRYGTKWFVIGSTACGAILTFITPWCAIYLGSTAVIVTRVAQGVCQSFMLPSISCVISKWIPLSERGRFGAFIFAGSPCATVMSMAISGTFAASSYGWPMNFYFFGTLTMIWCISFCFFGSNSPEQHKSISEAEKAFILKTTSESTSKKIHTPWRQILTSVPVWTCLYTSTCYVLLLWILLSQIPTYMNKIMRYNIKANGFLTALIYGAQWSVSLITSIVSDYLTNKNYLSITTARKTFTGIGMVIPSIALFFLAQCTQEDSVKGIICLIIGVAAIGSNNCGVFLTTIDIAPNHAGILQGFINGFSHIFALLAPLMVQVMVVDEYNSHQWSNVFYLSSGVALSGAICFGLLGSGDPQPWDEQEEVK